MRRYLLAAVCAGLAGCSSQGADLSRMTAATPVGPTGFSVAPDAATTEYRIGGRDKLRITVFRVPELSSELTVDAGGRIQLPLIGEIQAEGLTTRELAAQIESLLGERYLQDPQVSIVVTEAMSQKVTVDGAVTEPGVYEMNGRTTLLQAVAMAKGATRTANLGNVAVFRNVDGQRMVAIFDFQAIRAGRAEDPVIMGDDIVVVDSSRLNAALRDIVTALPAFAVFRSY